MKRPKGLGPKDEIPEIYYHGTTAANAKRILKEGLLVNKSLNREREEEVPFTFLSENIKIARMFAPGGDYWSGGKADGVILVIEPPESIISKLRFDLGEFVRCPVDIPAKYIDTEEWTSAD